MALARCDVQARKDAKKKAAEQEAEKQRVLEEVGFSPIEGYRAAAARGSISVWLKGFIRSNAPLKCLPLVLSRIALRQTGTHAC